MDTKCITALLFLLSLQTLLTLGEDNPTIELTGIVGKSLKLSCPLERSDPAQIAWKDNVWNQARGKEPIFNSSVNADIASGHLDRDNMMVDPADYSLTIKSLLSGQEEGNEYELSSSGDYFCFSLYDGKWHEQKFHISIAGNPKCTGEVNLGQGESTKLSCSSVFSGNMPKLQWFKNGKPVNGTDNTDIQTLQVDLEVVDASYADDEAIYTCRMTANDNQEECEKELSVKFSVRDMKLIPDKDPITIGEEIKCSARGNPQPTIKMEPETKSAYSGKGFRAMVVDDTWLYQMTTVSCTAENTVEGKLETIEKSITFNVTKPAASPVAGGASKGTENTTPPLSTPSPSESLSSESTDGSRENLGGVIAGIIIGALVLIVIVVAVVCLKRKDASDKNKGQTPLSTKEDHLLKDEENKV